jgi:radical SAM superfamily enzyme YgiQ (UPF0313 family)
VKVAFLSLQAKEPLAYGLMSLAGVLRHHGHEVELIQGRSAAQIVADPRTARADVLGMSATTGLHRVYVSWARKLRAAFPEKGIILGGPHPTFFPEVIEQAPFDGVCIGEGEESLLEFLESWEQGLPQAPEGWWVRRDHGRGAVIRGGFRPPIADLDALPPPAFDLYYDQDARYRSLPIRIFMASRGCPYRCTYCFNPSLNQRHKGQSRVVRHHDPERVVEEILRVSTRWGGQVMWFLDANLVTRRGWLEALMAVYRRKVALPFFCKLRPERATRRVVKLLADSGCTGVGVGIESGSERLRREVLGRAVTNSAILEGCGRLKAHGIRVMTFNMLGIPSETLDEALETVALNAACKVDYGGATILQPYPGTEISRWAIERGDFDGDFEKLSFSYFAASPMKFATPRHRDRITNLQRLFSFAVEFPEVRARLRWLIDRPPLPLYDHLFMGRHDWAMHQTFYRATRQQRPVNAGSEELLLKARRELGLVEP